MKKKLLILVSMLAVMFSLSACDKEVEAPFDYDKNQIVVDTMYLFTQYMNVSDEYADYYISDGSDFEKSAVKGIKQVQSTDQVGDFEDFTHYMEAFSLGQSLEETELDYEVVNAADSVSVTVTNHAKNRDVDITIKYVENPEYYIKLDQAKQLYNEETITNDLIMYYGSVEAFFEQYGDMYSSIDDLVQQGISDEMNGVFLYIPEEMVVSAVYSKAELMKQAGLNTAIGMGTVFVVLIFISFIISLFKYLPAMFAKKPKLEDLKKPEPVLAPAKAVPQASAQKKDDLMNDAELVAVITAAIYAAAGQDINGAVSKDTLVVRSIRRARR